jgi:hypothetical protein
VLLNDSFTLQIENWNEKQLMNAHAGTSISEWMKLNIQAFKFTLYDKYLIKALLKMYFEIF